MTMTGGYPDEAAIDEFLAARGYELLTAGNANFIAEHKQFVWGLLNAMGWSAALGVYCPTALTFNIRGGGYLFKGVVKTYTPGDAVNPTDNDTTYVWLDADNAVGSDIDGDGWPDAEHIKLAEIDVDSDGIITEVRDLRGETFLQYDTGGVKLLATVEVDLNAVGATEVYTVPTGMKMVVDHLKPRELSADAGSAQLTAGQSSAKTDFVGTQTLSNLDAAGKSCKIQPVPSATPTAIIEYTAGTVFVVDVTQAAGAACTCKMQLFGNPTPA